MPDLVSSPKSSTSDRAPSMSSPDSLTPGREPAAVSWTSRVAAWMPGLEMLRGYRREWLQHDVVAGLSVAAVALPVGIAYAKLAGFPPVVGIYSSILPLVAYALFGTSRQLMVNPDAAACAILAATLVPIAAGDPARYADLSIALAFLTGIACIAGGLIGFGVIANFLSRPILTGYLNGIALSIIAGQLDTLFGFTVPSAGFFHTLWYAAERLPQTHPASVALGVALIVLLWVIKRFAPRVPGPLVAAALGIAAVYALHLDKMGVQVVGPAPAGFPVPRIPSVRTADVWPLIFGACGIMLVSFCSMMTTARGFAAKNHYTIEPNKDLIALGVCDIASGLSRGFVVSGADSRTAVADSSGGKTQLMGIIAAAALTVVLLFLTGPIAFLPSVALAAILISASFSLFDFASLATYWRVSKAEFRHSVVAMLGVMTLGVLPGVLIAVGLAILRLLYLASRPHEALLGRGDDGSFATAEEGGAIIPGLIIWRFDSSLVFFNADYFQARVRALSARGDLRWFVFDAESSPFLDMTGAEALASARRGLEEQNIVLAIARGQGVFRMMLERTGVAEQIGPSMLFPTITAAAEAFDKAHAAEAPETSPPPEIRVANFDLPSRGR
jgi:high affinity sulfate transporter 1